MEQLTDRQAGIAYAVYSGMSNKQIACFYGLSSQTVKNHVTSLCQKLDVPDRTNIAIWWQRHAIGKEKPLYASVTARKEKFGTPNQKYGKVRSAITKEMWFSFLAAHGNKCLSCGSVSNLTKDHVVPLSKGGAPGLENVQPLCRRCNSRKGDKTIDYRGAFVVDA